MNGEELVTAMASGHERFRGITLDNLRITTVKRAGDRATSFLSFDWQAVVKSNDQPVKIPCQVTLEWDGTMIIAVHEVYDGKVLADAMEAPPKASSE